MVPGYWARTVNWESVGYLNFGDQKLLDNLSGPTTMIDTLADGYEAYLAEFRRSNGPWFKVGLLL
jgi:hypothetical protein